MGDKEENFAAKKLEIIAQQKNEAKEELDSLKYPAIDWGCQQFVNFVSRHHDTIRQALTTPPAQQQEGVVEALEGELRRLAGIILNCETCSNKMLEPIDTAAYRKGEKS